MGLFDFTGSGSAFNTAEGNTSAFHIEGEKLFLIDCGSTTFSILKNAGKLKSIKEIYVAITHRHSDHIGSLGGLIEYAYYGLQAKVHIITPGYLYLGYKIGIWLYLLLVGCGPLRYHWNFIPACKIKGIFKDFTSMRFVKTTHVSYLKCYSLFFDTKRGLVYYSGDTSNIQPLIDEHNNGTHIAAAYIECCDSRYKENPHMNVKELSIVLPENLRSRTTCMHFENKNCLEKARTLGFKIPTTLKH